MLINQAVITKIKPRSLTVCYPETDGALKELILEIDVEDRLSLGDFVHITTGTDLSTHANDATIHVFREIVRQFPDITPRFYISKISLKRGMFTKSSGNIFEDLGLSNHEKKIYNLSADTLKYIEVKYGKIKDKDEKCNSNDEKPLEIEATLTRASCELNDCSELIRVAIDNLREMHPRLKPPVISSDGSFKKNGDK